MKFLALTALLLLTLPACDSPTEGEPPSVGIEITTNSKVQNILNVTVNVSGSGVRQVTVLRDSTDNGVEDYQVMKQVTGAPFSFTFDDVVPGNGKYFYRVVALANSYRTTTDRQVTYTYTVGGNLTEK